MANIHSIATGMAGRYAIALFELARETNELEAVEKDLTDFAKMLDNSNDLKRLVRNPVFTKDEQRKALNVLIEKAELSKTVSNFVRLIIEKRRLFAISQIITTFMELLAAHRGQVDANVFSATPLSDEQISELKTSLKNFTDQDVQIKTTVDPSLLGGLIVKIGSRMIDTSLRTKLNNLKMTMKEVG